MIIGSILHGAYGDCYEQLLCLRIFKQRNPEVKIIVFYLEKEKQIDFANYDIPFVDGSYSVEEIEDVHVDKFYQFQIKDDYLQTTAISKLSDTVKSKFDLNNNLKPWSVIRNLDFSKSDSDIVLSKSGEERLVECKRQNNIHDDIFDKHFTIGYLYRARFKPSINAIGAMSPEWIMKSKSALFDRILSEYNSYLIVTGMNVAITDENLWRIGKKYTEEKLSIDSGNVLYLKGLSWALEIEIMKRCDLCIMMPSGFSEILWMKRKILGKETLMIDPPLSYLARMLYNRVPLYDNKDRRNMLFYLNLPHTAGKIYRFLIRKRLMPIQ